MAKCWDAGLTFASSLELGAGGGLVGLAVARGCNVRSPVLVTDQQEMFELMEHNIVKNDLGRKAKAAILNWCVLACQIC
jgi:protein N-lysine methyltransferase METTL21A